MAKPQVIETDESKASRSARRTVGAIVIVTVACLAVVSGIAAGLLGDHGPSAKDAHTTTGALAHWAGYAAVGPRFSSVAGTWTVPVAHCPAGSTSSSTTWIGMDGANSSHVEQTGSDSACSDGSSYYYVWVELYGTSFHAGQPVVSCAIGSGTPCIPESPVPGDSLTATVTKAGSSFRFSLVDTTAGWTYRTTVVDPQVTGIGAGPQGSSAEWITEDDGTSLTDFGRVTFARTSATAARHGAGATGFSTARLTAHDGQGHTLASVGPIGTDGSFTTTWVRGA